MTPNRTPTENISAAALEQATQLSQGLYPHQVEGIAFLLARQRAILADDMGLGKTRQSIVAMGQAKPNGPYLVVCPASVKRNWDREIRIGLDEEAETVVVDGATPVPEPGFGGWVVINYDILKKNLERLGALSFSGFVFDEAHYLKNHTSQRSRAAKRVLEATSGAPAVHCLTGTPLTNRPRDLFPLLQLINHSLGRSFLGFAKRYCDAYRNDYGLVADGASNIEELAVQLHGAMLRRRKDDVLDLPAKVRTWLSVDIPETTGRREIRQLLQGLIAQRDAKQIAGDQGTVDDISFQLLGKLAPARKRIAIAKVKNTIEFVQGIVDQGEKVIVYSCFTVPVQRVAEHFGDSARQLTGKTPANQRQGVVDAFQKDDSVRVLAANIIAGGVGVNLTEARTVVFNDLDWVPANHWQAEDRAYRIGQKHAVNVYYFRSSGGLDEFVGQVLETKSRLVADVIEGGAVATAGAATADVLSELRLLINKLTPQFADRPDDAPVDHLLREATDLYRNELSSRQGAEGIVGPSGVEPSGPAVSLEAIRALAKALSRPRCTQYRIAGSKKGTQYMLEVDGTDVICTCRGFEYRGQCRHARRLKEAITTGQQVPAEYESMETTPAP